MTNNEPDLQHWQPLSPWSIVSYIASSLIAIFSNGYALVPIIYTGWQKGFSLQWSIAATGILTFLLTLAAIIEWRKFRYRLINSQLEVKRGLFFTKKDEIPLDKIQNIRYEQPFYFKPLKLATLVIETAGSKKDEASLRALDIAQAHGLKSRLLKKPSSAQEMKQASMTEQTEHDATQQFSQKQLSEHASVEAQNQTILEDDRDGQHRQLITQKSLKELILFGLYQNNFIWFAIIAGPIAGQVQWDKLFDIPVFQQLFTWLNSYTQHNVSLQLMVFGVALLLCYALISLISILASVLKYHPYTLHKHKHTLQRSGGVISHQQDALKMHRIQLVHFEQPVIARLLKRWTIYFKQVKGQEVEQKAQQHMLVPSMQKQQIKPLLASISGLSGHDADIPPSFTSINISWFYKRAQLTTLLSIIASIACMLLDSGTALPIGIIWVATLLIVGMLYLRYQQWGYYLDDEVVWQHSGLLGQHWKRIPFEKVQHVKITQTRTQKKSNLAYLELGLASGSLTLPYIPLNVAQHISAKSLHRVNRNHHNWI